jgi:hypothetical protein
MFDRPLLLRLRLGATLRSFGERALCSGRQRLAWRSNDLMSTFRYHISARLLELILGHKRISLQTVLIFGSFAE